MAEKKQAQVPSTRAPMGSVPDTQPSARPVSPVTKQVTVASSRDFTGQRIGIKLPNGAVRPIAEDQVKHALIGGRVLANTPMTGYQIVDM